jgi:diphthine-ammonia ligase
MKLAALYSGGKDSTYAIYRAKQMGHEVVRLITFYSREGESKLFHRAPPFFAVIANLGKAMGILVLKAIPTSSEAELRHFEKTIEDAKKDDSIEGTVHGFISGTRQKQTIDDICGRLNLKVIAPLWNVEPATYMKELLDQGFAITIVGVASMGLDKEWLGKQIDRETLPMLAELAKRNGFSLTFEGGAGETLVTDCPLYTKKLQINSATTHWDGQRGTYEIKDVSLVEK